MLRIAIIGSGAIGSGVLELLQGDPQIKVERVVTAPQDLQDARAAVARLAPGARVTSTLEDANRDNTDLVLECAGHAALKEHVVPALERGLPCFVASVGALSEPGLPERLESAAKSGATQVHLLSGAIGAIDALAAAKIGGLDSVTYIGRKPPHAWKDTPAEEKFVLEELAEATKIFDGSARDAARLYPKNANVAATLSLAGLGLDQTRVQLWADPGVSQNVHQFHASGSFGDLELTLRGKPLAANPKTSALTVYSAVRAIHNRVRALTI